MIGIFSEPECHDVIQADQKKAPRYSRKKKTTKNNNQNT